MAKLPNIRARLVERFIFNFRFPVHELDARLPQWLAPQVLKGCCAASFCVLDLDQVTFGPMPDGFGLRNINCALRFGVVHRKTGEPAVYVAERNTNSRLGAFVTSLGFPGEHRLVDASIKGQDGNGWTIQVRDSERMLFSAHVKRHATFASSLFESLDALGAFMAAGIRSYCPARRTSQFNVVDLHKEEPTYEPLAVAALEQSIFSEWAASNSPVVLDCAVRTHDGRYVWEYVGQRGGE